MEQSEQGFLNKVFPLNGPSIVELPFEASGNSALEVRAPAEWERRLHNLRIIHFTERKPWQCAERQGPAVISSSTQRLSCGDGYSAPPGRTIGCVGGALVCLVHCRARYGEIERPGKTLATVGYAASQSP